MAKEWAKSFYNSKVWESCRGAYISHRINVDGGMCEHCRRSLGYIVDHIEELTPENILNPEIALNHFNFQYLCLVCHNKKTFGNKNEQIFDDEGQPIPPIHQSMGITRRPMGRASYNTHEFFT